MAVDVVILPPSSLIVTDIVANTYDAAKTAAETSTVSIAAAFLQTLINLQYLNLARDYYNLYKDQRDFYYNTFQQNGELPFANEQFSVAQYNPDYVGLFNAGILPPGALYIFKPIYNNRRVNFISGAISRHARMYNAQVEQSTSLEVDLACTYTDWFSYQFRYEEHKRDVFNERRWANQMDALSYGIKEAATVERGLATSFNAMDEASTKLGNSFAVLGDGYALYKNRKNVINNFLGMPAAELKPINSNYDETTFANYA